MNKNIKKVVFALAVCVSFAFSEGLYADVEHDDYAAYVIVPYEISAGKANSFTIGDETFKIQGARIKTVEISYQEAVQQYNKKYNLLKSILASGGDDSLSKASQVNSLSSWKLIVDNALRDGAAKQSSENQRYVWAVAEFANDGIKTVTEQNVEIAQAQTQASAKLQELVILHQSSSSTLADGLDVLAKDIESLRSETLNKLESTNKRMSELLKKTDLTEQEVKEMQNLKQYATKLAAVERSAKEATTKAQRAYSLAMNMAEEREKGLLAITNSLDHITKWSGFKEADGESLAGVFQTPQLFKQGSPFATDVSKNTSYDLADQSIFTMLSDAGIVPVLTKQGVTEWETRAGAKPRYYILYEGEGDKRTLKIVNSGSSSEKDAGLPAIKNWADGETITVTGGVFVAKGAKGDANVGATIEAWLNKNKSSGIKGELTGAAAKKDDDNLWSTNNVLNPANPAFDKSNRNNIWNLLAYCGDSDVSPKDAAEGGGSTKALNSIQFLGSYSEAFGNAFSLYGFYKAKSGMFPYVEGADTENTLLWKMELEGGSERDAYSSGNLPDTIEVVKVSDDDSEVVEAEKRRILSLKGFDSAEVGQVAYKKSETELGWKSVGVKFVGTDGSSNWVDGDGNANTNTPGQVVTFASASDSNVKVNVEKLGDDGVKITIGVYYK